MEPKEVKIVIIVTLKHIDEREARGAAEAIAHNIRYDDSQCDESVVKEVQWGLLKT